MNLVIAGVVVVWLLIRQLTPRPVKEKSLFGVVILAYGVFAASTFPASAPVTVVDVAVLIGSAILGCALAALRAFTVRLRREGDRLIQQGTALTALLWIVGLAQHLLSELLMTVPMLAQATLLLYVGVVILVQRAVLLARARSAGHLAANGR